MSSERLPHLIVTGFFGKDKYTATPRPGPDFNLPARDRTAHGSSVREQLQKVRGENDESRGECNTEQQEKKNDIHRLRTADDEKLRIPGEQIKQRLCDGETAEGEGMQALEEKLASLPHAPILSYTALPLLSAGPRLAVV